MNLSSGRLEQYKRDVWTLLFYSSEFLLCVCTCIQQLLAPHPGDHGPRGLHHRAALLLTTLAAITAPNQDVNKV